jgi:hypothetical protein
MRKSNAPLNSAYQPASARLELMSAEGQTRKSALAIVRSGLPPKADSTRTSRHVGFVPNTEVSALSDYMAALAINR